MIRKVKAIPIVAALLWGVSVQAQDMSPSIINATGGSMEISGNTYEYSIGEMVLVSTFSSPQLIVTQGVLQPTDGKVSIGDLTLSDKEINVYPNPSEDIVYIQPNLSVGGKFAITLMDITGKQLSSQTVQLSTGNEKQSIRLNSFASGTYMLQIAFTHENKSYLRNFKIQKIK